MSQLMEHARRVCGPSALLDGTLEDLFVEVTQ